MERLTWISWRAFWVGLGAATVIIGQALFAPVPGPTAATPAANVVRELAPPHGTSFEEAPPPAYGTRYVRDVRSRGGES